MQKYKVCTKCKEELPVNSDYFHKHSGMKDGFQPRCKVCRGTKYTRKLQLKEGYKYCSKCKRSYPETVDFFHVDNNATNGFKSQCKKCYNGVPFTTPIQPRNGKLFCNECYNEKPENDFHTKISSNRGFSYSCKECIAKKDKQYYRENKEQIKKRKKEYYYNNITMIKKKSRKKYLEERDSILRYQEWYRENNKEKVAKNNKQYYIENREEILAKDRIYGKKYYKRNKKSILEKSRVYRHKNRELHNALARKRYNKKIHLRNDLSIKQWLETKRYFNNSCAYCGMSEEAHLLSYNEQLHQEHIVSVNNGGGYTKHNIIPSCKGCNSSKHNKELVDWYLDYEYYNSKRLEKIINYINKYNEQKASSK